MPRKLLLAVALLPLLGACVAKTQGAAPAGASRPVARPPAATVPPSNPAGLPSTTTGFRAPRVMNLRGVEGLIGANAATLQRQFGTPRLDVLEGDARKLQFSGEACVLDIYLYPVSSGAEPTATYVDARRASDGLDVDRAACVQALLKR